MTLTHLELDEMEAYIKILEGALGELPTLIFLMKIGLHQGRARLRTREVVGPHIDPVDVPDVVAGTL